MLSSKNLELYLKSKHNIAVGEVTFKELKDKVKESNFDTFATNPKSSQCQH